ITCLHQDVVDSGPVHGKQERVRSLCGLAWCARARVPLRVPRELSELLLVPRIAEAHLMSGPRPDRADLAATQSRTQNAHAHPLKPRPALELIGVARPVHGDP